MARTFQKFLQSKIDLSSVGLEFREDNAPYFCTPTGEEFFRLFKLDSCLRRCINFGAIVDVERSAI